MKVKKSIFKRKRFWLVAVTCFGLWVYSVFNFIHFADKNYVGEILEITDTSITVNDGKIGATEILYNENTKIITKNSADTLKLGTPVFVGSRKNQDDVLQADFIRFIDEKHFPKNN